MERNSETSTRRLEELLEAPSKSDETSRLDYRRRLSTFSPSTYFAKPPSLSPIVCSRFGWKNVDKDLLVCEQCQAAWIIYLPPQLSSGAARRLTCRYEEQLASAHDPACAFRAPAAAYRNKLLQQQSTAYCVDESDMRCPEVSIVPSLFASILPVSWRDLFDDPMPLRKFATLVQGAISALQDATYPHSLLDLSDTVLYAQVSESKVDEQEESTMNILERIEQRLAKLSPPKIPADTANSALAIATVLFGWCLSTDGTRDAMEDVDFAAKVKILATCSFCLAELDLHNNNAQPETDEEERAPKRRRPLPRNVLTAHRHYCPYVCGFPVNGSPQAAPLWSLLARRLMQCSATTPTYATASEAFHEVHRILQESISPRIGVPGKGKAVRLGSG